MRGSRFGSVRPETPRRRSRRSIVVLLVALVIAIGHSTAASAQAAYSLWTGQTGAQTQIDVNHTSSWYITVNSGTVLFGGGQFTIKRGSATTASITLKLYAGSAAGSLLASKTVLPSGVGSSYANVDFSFATPLSLGPGTYFASVTSSAIDTASQQYFIKGGAGALISLDGVTPISSSVASTSATPSSSNFILSKSATGTVNVGGPITYTLGLGNDGGSPSGTTATVSDQLPTGVTATVATAGTGVGSVTCSNLGVTSALVTCTVNLSAAINSGAPTGTASFTLAATAPSTGGTAVNYASVDAAGGASPATPGAACTTASCASATSTVTAPSLDITKTSSAATLTRGGTATFTLTVRNSGNGPTTGATVTVTDTFPAGLTPTAASGTGWSCSIAGPIGDMYPFRRAGCERDLSNNQCDLLGGECSGRLADKHRQRHRRRRHDIRIGIGDGQYSRPARPRHHEDIKRVDTHPRRYRHIYADGHEQRRTRHGRDDGHRIRHLADGIDADRRQWDGLDMQHEQPDRDLHPHIGPGR